MEFLADYGLFLAKTVTLLVALGIAIAMIAGASRRGVQAPGIRVDKLNDRFRELGRAVRQAALSKSAFKKHDKADKQARKKRMKAADQEPHRKRFFVIDFKGDIRATAVTHLREEISAVVSVADASDEVVLRLENAGGAVHDHGLAASQLLRLKSRGIPLTVIVDKVAASGGYMMACVANRIIAAPFAVIGSIGVLAQLPNFNRALKDKGVDWEEVTAGKYKRTITMFGENTPEDREKLREELEEVHRLFKAMVGEHRPDLDLEKIATGEHWYGTRALELGLVDELGASDDYLLKAVEDGDVLRVQWKGKPSLQERIMHALDTTAGAFRRARWDRTWFR